MRPVLHRSANRAEPAARGGPLLAIALLAAIVWLLAAPAAGAHATLESASPADGAVLDAAPDEIVLTFDETVSVQGEGVRVFDPAGNELEGVAASAVDEQVTATLPDLTEEGSYTVSYKVVSADGHAVAGAYLFHIGQPTLSEPVVEASGSTPFAADVLRFLGAIGLFVSLTSIAGPWWFDGRRRRSRIPWAVAVVSSLLLVAGGVVAADGFSTFVGTVTGRAVMAVVGLTLVGLALAATSVAPVLATVGIALAALPGHAVSLAPVPLSITLTAVHVLGAAVWIWGVLTLERASRSLDEANLRSEVLRRSSVLIGASLAVAATGITMTLDRAGWVTLFDSTYGTLAAVKFALFALAIGLAGYHRFVHADTRTLRVEIAVLGVAVIVAAVLAQVPPPGEGSSEVGGPFVERQDFGSGKVELYVIPGERGRNELHVTAFDEAGSPDETVEDLAATLSLPSRDITGVEANLEPITNSHAIAQDVQLPFAGTWTVIVSGRHGNFEALRAEFRVPIGTDQ